MKQEELQTVWIGPTPQEVEWYFNGPRSVGISMTQFSRHDGDKKLCRWFTCTNPPHKPYREYCSKECSDTLDQWYWMMFEAYFSWDECKNAVWKRDKGRCKICRIKLDRNASPQNHMAVEFDHIIPEDYALTKMNYDKSCKADMFRFLREILFAVHNVRCLCYPCHKKVTANYNSKRMKFKQSIGDKQKAYETALWKFRLIFKRVERDANQRSLAPFLEI